MRLRVREPSRRRAETTPRLAGREGQRVTLDKDAEDDVKGPKAAEAREWLDPKHKNHGVFELGNDQARKVVEGFYKARRCGGLRHRDRLALVTRRSPTRSSLSCPLDPQARKSCFSCWEQESGILEGEEPTADVGQRFLSYTTD